MSFLREILDSRIIAWDDARYRRWEKKQDRRWNARDLTVLPKMEIPWTRPDYDGDGGVTECAPDYPEEVTEWVERFVDLGLVMEDYGDRYEELFEKDISRMVLEETLTLLSWIICTERVMEGTLARAIEDGTVEALSRRTYRVTHYSEKESVEEAE